MGRHFKFREAALALSIALPIALPISGAAAFQAETVAPPQQQSSAQSAPLSPFGQQLSLPNQPQQGPADPLAITGKDNGTEVTIPGIGTVGKLPKLDFGLELLYGAKSAPDSLRLEQPQTNLDQHVPENEMQIKGTLSHKF
jgi:hypothetical protein